MKVNSFHAFLDRNRRSGSSTLIAEAARSAAQPVWVVVADHVQCERMQKQEGLPKDYLLTPSTLHKAVGVGPRPVLLDPDVFRILEAKPEEQEPPPKEHLGWSFVHNCIAHPLMFLFRYPRWSERFHDWTGVKAWPKGT